MFNLNDSNGIADLSQRRLVLRVQAYCVIILHSVNFESLYPLQLMRFKPAQFHVPLSNVRMMRQNSVVDCERDRGLPMCAGRAREVQGRGDKFTTTLANMGWTPEKLFTKEDSDQCSQRWSQCMCEHKNDITDQNSFHDKSDSCFGSPDVRDTQGQNCWDASQWGHDLQGRQWDVANSVDDLGGREDCEWEHFYDSCLANTWYRPKCDNWCPPLYIENGTISGQCNGTVDDSCVLQCDAGYQLKDTTGWYLNGQYFARAAVRQCQADGKWSSPDVVCARHPFLASSCNAPDVHALPHQQQESCSRQGANCIFETPFFTQNECTHVEADVFDCSRIEDNALWLSSAGGTPDMRETLCFRRTRGYCHVVRQDDESVTCRRA